MPFVLTLACPLFPAPPTARPLIPTDPLRPTTCNARTYLQPQLNKAIRRDESLSKADKNLKDWIVFRYAPFYPLCLFNPLFLSPFLSLVLSTSLPPSLPPSTPLTSSLRRSLPSFRTYFCGLFSSCQRMPPSFLSSCPPLARSHICIYPDRRRFSLIVATIHVASADTHTDTDDNTRTPTGGAWAGQRVR